MRSCELDSTFASTRVSIFVIEYTPWAVPGPKLRLLLVLDEPSIVRAFDSPDASRLPMDLAARMSMLQRLVLGGSRVWKTYNMTMGKRHSNVATNRSSCPDTLVAL